MSKFISCDWGTSNLRLRLVDRTSKTILKEFENQDGIAAIYRLWKDAKHNGDRVDFYLSFLQKHIDPWIEEYGKPLQDIPVIISGMASSTIGLIELEYATLPTKADGSELVVKRMRRSDALSNKTYIISGVCSENDVMRGEETLLAGCNHLAGQTELFVFPGTHSKHILVSDGRAENLVTFMTGEFFELLSHQSILSASVEQNNHFDKDFFMKGVLDGVAGNLLNVAFQVRINALFKRASPGENYHYLSGLLIGSELKEFVNKDFSLITFVASGFLIEKYLFGLKALGYSGEIKEVNAASAMINGHSKILSTLSLT